MKKEDAEKKVKNTVRSIRGRKSRLRGREASARGKVVMVRALSGSGHRRSKIQVFCHVMQCHQTGSSLHFEGL